MSLPYRASKATMQREVKKETSGCGISQESMGDPAWNENGFPSVPHLLAFVLVFRPTPVPESAPMLISHLYFFIFDEKDRMSLLCWHGFWRFLWEQAPYLRAQALSEQTWRERECILYRPRVRVLYWQQVPGPPIQMWALLVQPQSIRNLSKQPSGRGKQPVSSGS